MFEYPNSFIFAPQKCGTTALYWILDQHPEINSSIDKEVNFMNRVPEMLPIDIHEGAQLDLDRFKQATSYWLKELKEEIRSWYNKANWETYDRTRIDISPLYFSSAKNIYSAYHLCPWHIGLNNICITRDPVERFISHYVHERATAYIATNPEAESKFVQDIDWADVWEEQKIWFLEDTYRHVAANDYNFDKELFDRYLIPGDYGTNLCYQTILDCTEKSINTSRESHDLLYIEYDDFKNNYDKTIHSILKFLGLSTDVKLDNVKTNESSFWKKYYDASEELTPKFLDKVKEYYKESNEIFKQLSGIDYNERY